MTIKNYLKNLLTGLLLPTFLIYDIVYQSYNILFIIPIALNGFIFPVAIVAIEKILKETNNQKFWHHYKTLPTFGSSGLYAIYWLIVSLLAMPITIIYIIFNIIKKGR